MAKKAQLPSNWFEEDLEEAAKEVETWPEWMRDLRSCEGATELELSLDAKKQDERTAARLV